MATNDKTPKRKCCICHKPIEGDGHNPIPVWPTGRCCTKCHLTYVIPMRMKLVEEQEQEDKKEEL